MRRVRRGVVVVLDGFGIGAMADAEPTDRDSHTLRTVGQARPPLELPTLQDLGLGSVAGDSGLAPAGAPAGAHGRAAAAYPGADTFMGHQELMGGSLAAVRQCLLSDVVGELDAALRDAGHRIEPLEEGHSARLVDGCILVADNVEARPGMNINVTASQDDVTFDDLTVVGQLIRDIVPVPRVIVVGGRGFGVADIRDHMLERTPGQYGVDTPGMGVYDEDYQVRHLGANVAYDRQLPSLARARGLHVVLLGKAADVVRCDGAIFENHVNTDEVFDAAQRHLEVMTDGLVVANVQETDLAGHEQDPERFRRVLQTVDRRLALLIDGLGEDDLLLVSADHGNDPCVGHSQHTREFVPILAAAPWVQPTDLGTRDCLADAGATMADALGIEAPEAGMSFLKEIG